MKKLLRTRKNQKGFTLVELLIAITILAILAVIGVTTYSGLQTNARNARRRADVDQIAKSIEVHYNQSTNQFCTGAAGTYCAPAANWYSGGTIPVDPGNGASYTGLPANGVTTFTACATLETTPASTYCRSNQQ